MSDRIRILIIDDDPMFRNLLFSLLRKDYIISVASDGSDGYHKALQHPPDVAIVDIQMPEWDGLRTLKEFRRHPALTDVHVMMLTSDASRETVLAAIEAGASDYVIKTSFSKEEFYRKLDKLVAGTPRAQALAKQADEQLSTTSTAENDAPEPGSDASPAPEHISVEPVGVGAADEDDAALQEMIDDWE